MDNSLLNLAIDILKDSGIKLLDYESGYILERISDKEHIGWYQTLPEVIAFIEGMNRE